MSEIANDHPQLQSAKATAELYAVIRSAAHFFLFRGAQIFRHERKRAAQQIQVPTEKDRTVEWREQPLVGIEHQRISAMTTVKNVAHLRHDGGGTAVSRIDVQPHRVLLSNRYDLGNRIDA